MNGNLFSHIEKGAISEISGPRGGGKTETLLRFLGETERGRIMWIEREFTIYPCAFPQSGLALERVLFVQAPARAQDQDQDLWCAQQALQSQAFGTVVLSVPKPLEDAVVLRRLQLAAEKSRTSLILLSEKPAQLANWAIRVQLEVRRPFIQVLRKRGGGLADSIIHGGSQWNRVKSPVLASSHTA